MEEKLTAKMVDELLPTENGKLIDQLYRAKKKTVVEEELGISIRNGSGHFIRESNKGLKSSSKRKDR